MISDAQGNRETNGNVRISVVIPAFNAERYIRRAVNSAQNQTYSPIEIIVIDDGSSDQTRSLVEGFGGRVKYIHQDNQGTSRARNTGIQAAKGDYIAFLDADDKWMPQHLENAAKVLGSFPELSWYSCALMRKGRSKLGRISRFHGKLKDGAIIEDYFSAAMIPGHNLVSSNTVVARRRLLLSLGGFREKLHRGEDRLMWFRLGLAEPRLGYSRAVGAIYHIVEGSLTNQEDIKNPGGFIGYVVSATKENWDLPVSKSCISFLNQLVLGEIHHCFMTKDSTSLLKIKKECKELISPKNLRLIRMGLLFPKIMKGNAILTNFLRRQRKRIDGIFVRIRILLHGSHIHR